MRVRDKVTIVTGAGSGVGKAIATRLAREGASVIVAEMNVQSMNDAVHELESMGCKASEYNVDVRSPSSPRARS